MKNILLTISYDGTDFCGFQRQDFQGKPPQRTVQQEIENALEKLCKTQIKITGAGRTDSGVHARSQKINFFSPIDSIPIQKYSVALNSILPKDIRIHSARIVSKTFSARFCATKRTYRYYIAPRGYDMKATQTRYIWQIGFVPNIDNLNDMSSILCGEKDFKSFCAADDKSLSTFRNVFCAKWFYQKGILVFEISSNAFLQKMIRNIVGTLLDLDKRKAGKKNLEKILQNRDRKTAGPTAPAVGLFLHNVSFQGKRVHI